MSKFFRSPGARYVKGLPMVIQCLPYVKDRPVLLWHPVESHLYRPDGSSRVVYGLEVKQIAQAICELNNVKFIDGTLPFDEQL